jgi:hypothetical protein
MEFGGLVKRQGENQALEQGFRNFHRKGAEGEKGRRETTILR